MLQFIVMKKESKMEGKRKCELKIAMEKNGQALGKEIRKQSLRFIFQLHGEKANWRRICELCALIRTQTRTDYVSHHSDNIIESCVCKEESSSSSSSS